MRNMDKCVMCRSCETVCNEIQTVGALSAVNRGFMAVVAPAFEQDLTDSPVPSADSVWPYVLPVP